LSGADGGSEEGCQWRVMAGWALAEDDPGEHFVAIFLEFVNRKCRVLPDFCMFCYQTLWRSYQEHDSIVHDPGADGPLSYPLVAQRALLHPAG